MIHYRHFKLPQSDSTCTSIVNTCHVHILHSIHIPKHLRSHTHRNCLFRNLNLSFCMRIHTTFKLSSFDKSGCVSCRPVPLQSQSGCFTAKFVAASIIYAAILGRFFSCWAGAQASISQFNSKMYWHIINLYWFIYIVQQFRIIRVIKCKSTIP